jgi:hypothetical protein
MKYWTLKDIEKYYRKHNTLAKIRKAVVEIKFDTSKFKSFEDLTLSKQSIVEKSLSTEKRIGDIERFVYWFTKISTNKLGISHWEDYLRYVSFPEDKKFKQEEIESIKKPIKKIKALEYEIYKKGYNKNKPIMLQYYPDGNRVFINGGHHRLQAVRNLINNKKLPSNFNIPCLVKIWKKDFNYRKINYKGIIDYSFKLDLMINKKNYKRYEEDPYGLGKTREVSIEFHFNKYGKYVNLYMNRIGNVIYVKFPLFILFKKKKEKIPIVVEFINKKIKRKNIKLKFTEVKDKEINEIIKKLIG